MRNVSTNVSTNGSTSGYKNAENVSKSGYKLCPDMEPQDSIDKGSLDKGSKDNNIIALSSTHNTNYDLPMSSDELAAAEAFMDSWLEENK